MNEDQALDFVLEMSNHDVPIIEVNHADLERIHEDTMFKSHCPKCKRGTLLVCRNPVSMKLQARDRCVLCAQKFLYMDMQELCDKVGEPGPHEDDINPLPHTSSVKNKEPTRFSNLTIPEEE